MQHLFNILVLVIKLAAFWLLIATPSLAGNDVAFSAGPQISAGQRHSIHLPPSNPRRARPAGSLD